MVVTVLHHLQLGKLTSRITPGHWGAVSLTPNKPGPLSSGHRNGWLVRHLSKWQFIGENKARIAARYASTLEKSGAVNLLKEDGLLFHDMATPH